MALPIELRRATETWTQANYGDVFAILVVIVAVSSFYISKRLSNPIDIPDRFWHEVPQASSDQTAAREKTAQSRNIAIAFREQDIKVVIFWGSQSGRAEVLAKRLARSIEDRFGLRTLVADLDDYDHIHLSELRPSDVCGFILATYGDGDPPDNTNGFWDAVSAVHQEGRDLSNLHYVVFGLGNSKYRQYNRVADKVDSIFQSRNAVRYGDPGRGDDAHGSTEDDFLIWRQPIEEELKFRLQLTEQNRIYQPAFNVEELKDFPPGKVYMGEPHTSMLDKRLSGRLAFDADVPSVISVASIRKLWESNCRLCLHVDFDLGPNRFVKFKTGDHFTIWSSNPDHEVEKLLLILNVESKRNTAISIACVDGRMKNSIPTPTTVESLFRYYLEICGKLSRETLFALSAFAPSVAARVELERISENPSIFKFEVSDRNLTLADLMAQVSEGEKWAIPHSFLIETLKQMQPRYYSISSSASVEPRRISITAVVEKPAQTIQRGCWGLATSYLHALEQQISCSGSFCPTTFAFDGPRNILSERKVFGRVRSSAFKLPFKASTPIIMIGCGTGVAPFRAFVQERVRRKAIGQEVGKMLLFMGFRHPDEDYIYEEEWREAQETLGVANFKICTAFSREDPSRRVYVQNRIRENADEVLDLFENNFQTRMYICGSAEMARDVASTLAKIRSEAKTESLEQASEWVKSLRQLKLLLEDVWN